MSKIKEEGARSATKTIEYGGKTLYVVNKTLNFYFVSEKEDGSKQYPISKLDYRAYHESSKENKA